MTDSDDDIMLPGTLNNNVLNLKFRKLQEAAQKTRTSPRGGLAIVQSSRPFSSRGIRPSSSSPLTTSRSFSNSSLTLGDHLFEELQSIRNTRYKEEEQDSSSKDEGSSSSTDNKDIATTFFSRQPRIMPDISDRKKFASTPPAIEYGFVRCYITRERGRFTKLFPKYYMWFEETKTFLLSSKKRKKNKTSNYALSLDDKQISTKNGSYFGKLRSNFLGTEFTIYDKGKNSKKAAAHEETRKQLGVISYGTNILGIKGPRQINVILPNVGADGKYYEFPEDPQKPTIMDCYRSGQTENLCMFKNKSPVWNEKLKAYVLNFNGRVTIASVKNFQLCDINDPGKTYLQFGKVDKNKFTLDYRHPISGIQAFCIALSALDSKLACE